MLEKTPTVHRRWRGSHALRVGTAAEVARGTGFGDNRLEWVDVAALAEPIGRREPRRQASGLQLGDVLHAEHVDEATTARGA